jgi:hypothetical protein
VSIELQSGLPGRRILAYDRALGFVRPPTKLYDASLWALLDLPAKAGTSAGPGGNRDEKP